MSNATIPAQSSAIEIVVCLGSSCFARGNGENLAILKEYVQSHATKAILRLSGKLCQEQCKQGPNLMIGGEMHHGVTAAKLRELLQQVSKAPRRDHGPA